MSSNNKKYRSQARDEYIRFAPKIDFLGDSKAKQSENNIYSMNYKINGLFLTKRFSQALIHNHEKTEKIFNQRIQRITHTFDLQHELISHYFGLILGGNCLGAQVSPVIKILFSGFHKSTVNLLSALDLTRKGLHGAARPIIRQSFESLITAKYCSIDNQSDVYDRWIDGINFSLSKAVLNKIKKPDTENFREFWKLMSQFTHSSVYASQPDFYYYAESNNYLEDIRLNLIFIEMMMECKYHLLISHIITSSMRYYQSYYGDGERVKKLKQLLKYNYSESKKQMGSGGKSLIKDYRSSWIVKI